jgi:hypothetical protein
MCYMARVVRRLNASITSNEAPPYHWSMLYNLSHEKIREMHREHYGFDRLPPADDPGWVCYVILAQTIFSKIALIS